MKKLKVLTSYDYVNCYPSVGTAFEDALKRREDVEVYRNGEIVPEAVDVCFNTLPKASLNRGPLTVWWDIEACNYHIIGINGEFEADLVLAPYTCDLDVYPKGTYLMPFACDRLNWHYYKVPITSEVGFIGREDYNRTRRVEYLNCLQDHVDLFRGYGFDRGEKVSKKLSESKILMQITGDALGGVMETRFFEIGLIGLMACDLTEANKADMNWVAVPDYHYIAFETKEEMVEKIWQVLGNEPLRKEMRRRAFKNHLKKHTYDVRVREFLETIGFLKGPGLVKLHARRPKWQE
jgi:hypothetical protein